MKKLLFIFLLIAGIAKGQTYPIVYQFTGSLGGWTVTNGSGLQYYSSSSQWLTTNIGTTPYPNSSTIIMTSPTSTYNNCISGLTVSFLLNGIVENSFDYMYFQYTTNGSTWTTLQTFTGLNNNVTLSYPISNNIIAFRFQLITNSTINTYGPVGHPSVYFYDIDNFTINCSSVLPIELLYFNADKATCHQNMLTWSTATETNNDHFDIESSSDGMNFVKIKEIPGAINSMNTMSYSYLDPSPSNSLNYYRLKQVDTDGLYKYSDIISVDNSCIEHLKILKVCNLLGQEVDNDFEGVHITYYNDGTVIKSINK